MRTLRALALLVAIACLGAGVTAWLHPSRPPWQRPVPEGAITATTLAAWLASPEPPLVLDARTAAEFAAGTIPGAVPFHDAGTEPAFLRLLETWIPGRRIVVFCGAETCDLSRDVAAQLRRDLGHDQIYHLDGGWDTWPSSR